MRNGYWNACNGPGSWPTSHGEDFETTVGSRDRANLSVFNYALGRFRRRQNWLLWTLWSTRNYALRYLSWRWCFKLFHILLEAKCRPLRPGKNFEIFCSITLALYIRINSNYDQRLGIVIIWLYPTLVTTRPKSCHWCGNSGSVQRYSDWRRSAGRAIYTRRSDKLQVVKPGCPWKSLNLKL